MNEAAPNRATEHVSQPFTFQSVSVTDIAEMSYGFALSPSTDDPNYRVRRNNTDWFKAWAQKQIAHTHDCNPREVVFEHFDVHPRMASSPDGFYYAVEGRWWLVPNRPKRREA